MNPTKFFDVAQLALMCVCDQMDALAGEDGVPDAYGCPCVSYVSAGEPSLDCCDIECQNGLGGQLTVHVEDTFPSDDFPIPAQDFEPCKAATWVAAIVVTIARCAPTVDEQGNAAPAGEQSDNALLVAVDTYAILTALGCCLVNDPPPGKRKRRVQVVGSRPITTSGGCAAIEVRAFVEVGKVCSCASEAS